VRASHVPGGPCTGERTAPARLLTCERHAAHILLHEGGCKDTAWVLDEPWPNPPRCQWVALPDAFMSVAGAPRVALGEVRYYSVHRTVWQAYTQPVRSHAPTDKAPFLVLQFVMHNTDTKPLAAWLESVQALSPFDSAWVASTGHTCKRRTLGVSCTPSYLHISPSARRSCRR
jgi:hypothetical protein